MSAGHICSTTFICAVLTVTVTWSGFGESSAEGGTAVTGSMKPIEASDVGVMMAFGQKVIVVPGYGMAVAQAQHKVWELTQLLQRRCYSMVGRHRLPVLTPLRRWLQCWMQPKRPPLARI